MAEQTKPKKSQPTTREPPKREEIEAELPQAPAQEPLAEPSPVAPTRGPGPRIEKARD
jgi:hypothetical protein